ncbi:hypothetical protein [Mesobacillus maritimus]|uniref:hypothetical protein n=1 Tax=Mesobacillus maritimus TaxID=1643336 RepID=UPI00384EB3B2
MKKDSRKNQNNEATLAPGMDDTEELNQEATNQEIENGEYTEVNVLSNDEVDPI